MERAALGRPGRTAGALLWRARPELVLVAVVASFVVVEPLGSEILLDVKIGPNLMVARVEPTVRVKMNESVKLALNPDQLHFFDSKTEQAV